MVSVIIQSRLRRGVSLLEVIACTGLVALLMLPMTGVLRSSTKSIRQSENIASAAELLPSSSLALQRYIKDCDVLVKYADDIVVVLRAGEYVEIYVSDGMLIAREPKVEVVIAEGIRSMTFKTEYRSDSGDLYGLDAVLEAVDSKGEPWTMVLEVDR